MNRQPGSDRHATVKHPPQQDPARFQYQKDKHTPTLALILFFGSGFGGLVYQVVWMRELSLLFGSTAQAAASTLSAFFLGLALGGRYWGRRTSMLSKPLRTYGQLELAVAASGLLFFLIIPLYRWVQGYVLESSSTAPALTLLIKFGLALLTLGPPAFFMGGSLPVLGKYLVRQGHELGTKVAAAYAINTLGAALGAYAAGFHLPQWLGYQGTYYVALGITVSVGTVAWTASLQSIPLRGKWVSDETPLSTASSSLSWRALLALSCLSGFNVLAMEVLWTRMFVQVLQNSVYTFATILVAFLIALSFGGFLASRLAKRTDSPDRMLAKLLFVASLLVAASPYLFVRLTGGLDYLGEDLPFKAYILNLFLSAIPVLLIPCLAMGALFPYLLKVAEPLSKQPGLTIGRLVAINTAGAILGACCAGFFFLSLLGLWKSILLLSMLYFMASVFVLMRTRQLYLNRWLLGISGIGLLLLFLVVELPLLQLGPKQELVEGWEGHSATVAVVREGKDLAININNFYRLGGTRSAALEERQAHLPLLLHPAPKKVFFLGMGSGITAGAALKHPTHEITVCELVPEVITASRKYFGPYLNGLFEDSRVRVIPEDGRNYLAATQERFDVIIADLFVPWKAGAANLYSLEHYRAARARLKSGGLYGQWVPLYQVSEREFGIIARTMTEVFPRVTLWRGDFLPRRSIALLLGHRDDHALNRSAIQRNLAATNPHDNAQRHPYLGPLSGLPGFVQPTPYELLMLYFCGELTQTRRLLDAFPINSDDYPNVAFWAPVTHRRVESKQGNWMSGSDWIRFCDQVCAAMLTTQRRQEVQRTQESTQAVKHPDRTAPLWTWNARLLEAGHHLHAGIIDSAKGKATGPSRLEGYKKSMIRYRQTMAATEDSKEE